MGYYTAELDSFDPNKGRGAMPQWATFVPRRKSGLFKLHTTEGLAANSLMAHGEGLLFECVNGVWEMRLRKDPDDYDHRCTECGAATATYSPSVARVIEHGRFLLRRAQPGRRLWKPLELMFCCQSCWKVLR